MIVVEHLIRSLRDTFPGRASEWALGFMIFNWSVVLTLNPDLFAQGRSYRELARWADQDTWAAACLVIGGVRLLVLAVNGAWRRSPHARAAAAFVSCFFWFQITLGLLGAGTGGTGLAVYPVLFLLDVFNAIRAIGEAGRSDRIYGRARHGTDT